jgi:segregation and condensation protein B
LNAHVVATFLKEQRSGELTRPALETLTIVAYRGPVAKSEIDLIRGVNCSLILRILLIRGLITAREDQDRMVTLYEISFDFLRHLGIREVRELPQYHELHTDLKLQDFLKSVQTDIADSSAEKISDSQKDEEIKTKK